MDQHLTDDGDDRRVPYLEVLPVELVRIVCEYCDSKTILQWQLVNRRFRSIVGAIIWEAVKIDGASGIVSFSLPQQPVTKSMDKFHTAIMDGELLKVPCSWLRVARIITPDDTVDMNNEVTQRVSSNVRTTQSLLEEALPQYCPKLEKIELRSTPMQLKEDSTDWPLSISTMFNEMPDAIKYLSLTCLRTASRPLKLVNVQVLELRTQAAIVQSIIGSEFPNTLKKLELGISAGEIDAEWFNYATTNCKSLRILHMDCMVHNPQRVDWCPKTVTELKQPTETPVLDPPMNNTRVLTLRAKDMTDGRIVYNYIFPNVDRLHLKVAPRVYNKDQSIDKRFEECCGKVTTLHVSGATLKYLSANLHLFPNVELLVIESVYLHLYRDALGRSNTYNASEIRREMATFAGALSDGCKSLKRFYLNRPEVGDYQDIMNGLTTIKQSCPYLQEIYLGSAKPNECSPQDGWVAVRDEIFATICHGVNLDQTFKTFKLQL